jgi:hypothetical protein
MPELPPLDVRNGLTQEAIGAMRRAAWLQITLTAFGVAHLTLWDSGQPGEPTAVLVLHEETHRPAESMPTVVLQAPGPVQGGPWERIAEALRAGDQLLVNAHSWGKIRLHLRDRNGFDADYALPMAAPTRS